MGGDVSQIMGDVLGTGRDMLTGPGAENLTAAEQVKRGLLTAMIASQNPNAIPALWQSFGQQDAMNRATLQSPDFQRRQLDVGYEQARREYGIAPGFKVPQFDLALPVPGADASSQLPDFRRLAQLPPPDPSEQLKFEMSRAQLRRGEQLGGWRPEDIGSPLTPAEQQARANEFAQVQGSPLAPQDVTLSGVATSGAGAHAQYAPTPGENLTLEELYSRGLLQDDGTPLDSVLIATNPTQPGVYRVAPMPAEMQQARAQGDYQAKLTNEAQFAKTLRQVQDDEGFSHAIAAHVFDESLIRDGLSAGPFRNVLDEGAYRVRQAIRSRFPNTSGNEALGTLLNRGESLLGQLARNFGGEKGVLTERDVERVRTAITPQAGDTQERAMQKREDLIGFVQELAARRRAGFAPSAGDRLVGDTGEPLGSAPSLSAPTSPPRAPLADAPMRAQPGTPAPAAPTTGDADLDAILRKRRRK